MNYSFATVLMTILASNLVIILITLCFRFEKLLLTIGYRLLAVFLVLTLIRFIFPFELPFAKSIYITGPLADFSLFMRHPLFGPDYVKTPHTPIVSILFLLQCFWLAVCVIKLFRHIRDYLYVSRFIRRYGRDISQTSPIRDIMQNICGSQSKRFRIITMPGLKTPQIFGIFSPRILLPDSVAFSQEDWYFTLQHEAFHYFHHDLLIKEGVSLLCIFYWWNPACRVLQKQVELLLEMHVDDSLSHQDPATISAYLRTLLRIAESTVNDTPAIPAGLTISAIGKNEDELVARFQMLCRKSSRIRLPLFLGLLLIVVFIYVGSHLFILEPSSSYMIEDNNATLGLTDGFYAVPLSDETFEIYYNDVLIERLTA